MLQAPGIIVAPGAYDGFSARLIEAAGFQAVYMTGAGTAASHLGQPDLGLATLTEMANHAGHLASAVSLPVIADADTGYGNALNVARTVKSFERAGAAAIQLEDQSLPKRCGHLDGKTLVPAAEMVGKIKAALDARAEALIIARTDAIAVEGFDFALERAERYLEAGADVLFIEALRSVEDMKAATKRFGSRAPLLANMVEGGKTPVLSATELEAMGFRIAIFPGALVRHLAFSAKNFLEALQKEGNTAPLRDRMFDFNGLNAVIGTPEMLALGKKYGEE